MKTKSWADIQRAKGKTDEQIEAGRQAARAELLEMDLRELRDEAGRSQSYVAAKTEVSQAHIPQLERQEGNMQIATVRKYVEALGGELKVVAVLGNKQITLRGL